MKAIRSLDPTTYGRHPIHGEGRVWAETNCYVDVVVELLHGLGFEPTAALPFTLSVDFEGDQWTFFKFRPEDLLRLYGIEVLELNPWRDLAEHVAEQIHRGRPVLVELDSYFLPDTQGSAYRLAHVKSTVAVNEIDVEAQHLGYFHGQGYHHLEGPDFVDVFQVGGLVHPRMLSPYIEYLKVWEGRAVSAGPELVEASLEVLSDQLRWVPDANPFGPFRERFAEDLEWLNSESMDAFHDYSFATLRQFGACFELGATYLGWLAGQGVGDLDVPIEELSGIAEGAKTYQFQLARALARGRELSLEPLETMGRQWDRGLSHLVERFG